MNLANEWLRLNGCPGIHGNADAFVGETSGHFEWEELPSGGRPHVGDILVWGISSGMPEGHVAVCLDGSVDPVAVLEENYPTGSCVDVGHHDRGSYIGVLRPHG